MLIAAADCTGHGVPGAMVSVVCSNALNRSVAEFGLTKPADILNKTQELVMENLGNSKDEVKDGMDIALCSFTKGSTSIEYAGAHNPLWIVGQSPKTKGELIELKVDVATHSLFELKANKQAIGRTEDFVPFNNHEIELEKESKIYLFSDGYLDQFGGSKGKKLKSRNLKELILKMQDLDIHEQGEKLRSEFVKWKGDLEQLDDVCIIGISV